LSDLHEVSDIQEEAEGKYGDVSVYIRLSICMALLGIMHQKFLINIATAADAFGSSPLPTLIMADVIWAFPHTLIIIEGCLGFTRI
jgi:hypothetical protein